MRLRRRSWLIAAACAGPFALAAPSADSDDQALNADADYAAGLAALKARDLQAALARFQAALKRFPDSADLHNELGFTFRQLGRFEPAFEHYRRALAIDPRHRSAHEYIGEAYLLVGDVASAEKHLAALRSICTLPCEEMLDLQQAIEAHRRKAPVH